MKKANVVASLALLSLLFISCAQPQIMLFEFVQKMQKMPVGANATIALTEADNGKKIEVKDGTYIQITLPVNPTTGYGWEIKDAPSAARVVVRVGEPNYVSDDPFSLKSGTGGHITYRFQALGIGEDTLEMELRRGKDVLNTFKITVESLYAK